MNFYEILKTKKLGRGSPDYWTQLFAEHVGRTGGWKVAELTGTLPLTFRSNGDDLLNYRIYGTADGAGETKNSLEITASSQTKNGVTFTVDKQAGTITANGTATANARINLGTVNIYKGTQYALSGNIVSPSSSEERICSLYVYQHSELGMDYGNGVIIDTTGDDLLNVPIAYMVYANKTVNNAVIRPMFRLADTAPDFEPFGYKIPLVTVSGTESKDTVIPIGDTKLMAGDYIDYESGKIHRGDDAEITIDLPAIETFNGENTLDSTETLGQVTIKGKIKPQS